MTNPTTNSDGRTSLGGILRDSNPSNKKLTDNAVVFYVRVLSQPLNVGGGYADLLLKDNFVPPPFELEENQFVPIDKDTDYTPRPRMVFFGKILRASNGLQPHIFLRDPCRLANSPRGTLERVNKLIKLHTLFISESGVYGVSPQIGDTVRVTLGVSDFQGPELKVASFSDVASTDDAELYARELADNCVSLKSLLFNVPMSEFGGGAITITGDYKRYPKNLTSLNQKIARPKFNAFIVELGSLGYKVVVNSVRRSVKHQWALRVGDGLDAAKPCKSAHQYGFAMDLKFKLPEEPTTIDGKRVDQQATGLTRYLCRTDCTPDMKKDKEQYDIIASIAKKHGVEWYGSYAKSWTKDPVHFRVPDNGAVKELKTACEKYYYKSKGGLYPDDPALWPSDFEDVTWPIECGKPGCNEEPEPAPEPLDPKKVATAVTKTSEVVEDLYSSYSTAPGDSGAAAAEEDYADLYSSAYGSVGPSPTTE